MRAIIILILTVQIWAVSGSDTMEISRISWTRMELTALYGGWVFGTDEVFINFYQDDSNTIRVRIYYSKKTSDERLIEVRRYIKRAMTIERTNMHADMWLSFVFEFKEWK